MFYFNLRLRDISIYSRMYSLRFIGPVAGAVRFVIIVLLHITDKCSYIT